MAAILFTAAVLKTHQLATEPVLDTGLLESRWFLVAVVEFELLLAFWLASGVAAIWAWRMALATFLLFAIVAGAKAVAGEGTCGCLGRVPTTPLVALAIDASAILVLCLCRAQLPQRGAASVSGVVAAALQRCGASRFGTHVWVGRVWLVVAIGLGFFAIRGARSHEIRAIGHRVGNLMIVEPDCMSGKPFELGKYIDIGEWISRGEWTVVLYRDGCPRCEDVMAGYSTEQLVFAEKRLAFVSVPPHSDEILPLDTSAARGNVLWGMLRDDVDWLVETPIVLTLVGNKVFAVLSPSSRTRGVEANRLSEAA